MSTAVESLDERILSALQERLEGIHADGGVTTWHTVEAVCRPDAITEAILETPSRCVCAIVPDNVDREELTFSGGQATMRVDVLAAARLTNASASVYRPETPIRQTVQTRLAHDVENRLRSDLTLGGLALNLRVTMTDYGADRTWVDGWAIAIQRVEILYSYEDGAL